MPDQYEAAMLAVIDGDADTLKKMLADDPGLATARSSRKHKATLLHYVGANGVENENQRTPPNAPEIYRILLEAESEADALADIYGNESTTMTLVVSSGHPFQTGVQPDLVHELVRGGAESNGQDGDDRPLHVAMCFGNSGALDALDACGVSVGNVVEAAATGDLGKLQA